MTECQRELGRLLLEEISLQSSASELQRPAPPRTLQRQIIPAGPVYNSNTWKRGNSCDEKKAGSLLCGVKLRRKLAYTGGTSRLSSHWTMNGRGKGHRGSVQRGKRVAKWAESRIERTMLGRLEAQGAWDSISNNKRKLGVDGASQEAWARSWIGVR